jgi:anti-anti-sigma factor
MREHRERHVEASRGEPCRNPPGPGVSPPAGADPAARDRGLAGPTADPAGRPAPAPELGPARTIEWLEAATGVRLGLTAIDRLVTVTLAGELDLASLDVIGGLLRDALAGRCARVELDLRGVSFIDDAGLRIVARATADARARRTPFVVSWPRDR